MFQLILNGSLETGFFCQSLSILRQVKFVWVTSVRKSALDVLLCKVIVHSKYEWTTSDMKPASDVSLCRSFLRQLKLVWKTTDMKPALDVSLWRSLSIFEAIEIWLNNLRHETCVRHFFESHSNKNLRMEHLTGCQSNTAQLHFSKFILHHFRRCCFLNFFF